MMTLVLIFTSFGYANSWGVSVHGLNLFRLEIKFRALGFSEILSRDPPPRILSILHVCNH